MKTISLTQGQVTLVDDDDFVKFGHLKWFALWNQKTKSFYAARNKPNGVRKQTTVGLSRSIMGEPFGMKVDHENHDTLDNRRCNLRVCNNSQNLMNRKGANENSTSGIRGVAWHKASGKWSARIGSGQTEKWLGTFVNKEDAISAYAKANRNYFGEFGGQL